MFDTVIGGNHKSLSSSQSEMAGVTNSTQMNVVKTYGEEKFHGARGHGFAAERVNDLYDGFTGKDATSSATTTSRTVRTESSMA